MCPICYIHLDLLFYCSLKLMFCILKKYEDKMGYAVVANM
jgi:hypothetical protein